MAAMSVIGIDLGNESCYVAVAKAGGIETIANDYSLRATPAFVAFSDKNRILGVAAKNQQVTNMKNTVYGLKRLLGRKFTDPHVQVELSHLPFNVCELGQENIGIKVQYLNEQHIFSPEQCLAMLLTKLKDVAANALQTPINDCVIAVPSYFTNNERKALLDAATIAGLNVLRLFNETTATALSYGIYKQDLPAPEEKPRNVVFVDCGHSSLQVSACAFHKDRLRMITTASDAHLGGRDFDIVLAEYFCKDFKSKYNVDAKTNPRAYLRLLTEVEKVKKQMSANSTTLPLAIECFMNDKDVRSEIKRADFEQLSAKILDKIEVTLRKCLDQSGLSLDEIHGVEVVGGSTRIPAIKQLIEKVFKKTASTTLNQDEAVSRGCALQCAMLSPAVRVREFNIKDVQNYSISVAWDASSDGESAGEVEAFPINHAVPYSRMLTFYRQEPFSIRAFYTGNIPYPDKNIGTWIIKDIRPNTEGKPQKVKVKVRININGIMSVSSASLFEAKETAEGDGEESQQQVNNQQPAPAQNAEQSEADAAMADGTAATPEDGDKDKKKKQIVKSIELPIESLTFGVSQVELNQFTEQEFKMIAADRQEKERADARNALEEYVYELRGKLSSDDELAPYILDKDRSTLVGQLDDMENWLYEEGEECNRQIYMDRLGELKSKGEPIQTRKVEAELRPHVIEDFRKSLQLGMKALDQINAKDAKFAHLSDDDARKVDESVKKSWQWLEDVQGRMKSAPKYQAPPVTVAQIRQEKNNYEGVVGPILNKPPPKAPSPPKDEKKPEEKTQQQNGPENPQQEQQQQQQNQSQENMEWSSTN